jgi:DNA polymerase-1
MKTKVILDMNNLAHRNYHGNKLATTLEQVTGLIFGCLNSILHIQSKVPSNGIIAVWDESDGSGYRKQLFPKYKAHRAGTEGAPDFYEQVASLKEILPLLGIPNVSSKTTEADDVIAALALRYSKDGEDVVILSNDGDFYQLITVDEPEGIGSIRIFHPKNGLTDAKMLAVDTKYAIRPSQVRDFKSIVGDPSDEYKGVPGLGAKTAQALFLVNKNLDGLFVSPMSLNLGTISARQAAAILQHKEEIKLYQRLAAFHVDRVESTVLDFAWPRKNLDAAQVHFEEYEFASFMEETEGKTRYSEFVALPQGEVL